MKKTKFQDIISAPAYLLFVKFTDNGDWIHTNKSFSAQNLKQICEKIIQNMGNLNDTFDMSQIKLGENLIIDWKENQNTLFGKSTLIISGHVFSFIEFKIEYTQNCSFSKLSHIIFNPNSEN